MLPGELFILSAPSGAGKTTMIQKMMNGAVGNVENLAFSVSHTTRRPRRGEVDGRDYHFVDQSEFERMVQGGEFLEWARVHARCYGTSIAEVEPRLAAGVDVLVDVDVQGAEQILDRIAGETAPFRARCHSIFVMPPSFEALEQRLASRGLDDPEQVALRLEVSHWEMSRVDRYDYVIVNDEADRASMALASILLEKRHRQARMHERVHAVLDQFVRSRGSDAPAQFPREPSEESTLTDQTKDS